VKERRLRLLLLLLTISPIILFNWKGRDAPQRGMPAAFLRYTTGMVLVRLRGNVPQPGVHRFSDSMTVGTVIKMAAPENARFASDSELFGKRLQNGDVLTVALVDGQPPVFSMEVMKAPERIALGIPLHPDSMSYDDWVSLPGIGPKLAETIMTERQQNGDFGSLDGVLRVPGIGEGKLKIIKRYF